MAAIEIALTVLYGILGWSALESWKHGVKFVKERRPLTKLFPFDKHSKVWIVLSEFKVKKEGEFFDTVSPIDGIYSFDDLSDNLRRIGLTRRNFATLFSSDLTSLHCEDNLILIGGYENNSISKRMNEEHYKKRHFYLKNNKIIERGGEDREWGIDSTHLDKQGRIARDYCLVTKIHNPFCTGKEKPWVLAFEGVREYGTWGAVRHWNESIFKEFKRLDFKVKRGDTLELVIAIDVDQDKDNLFQQIEFGGIKSVYVNNEMMK